LTVKVDRALMTKKTGEDELETTLHACLESIHLDLRSGTAAGRRSCCVDVVERTTSSFSQLDISGAGIIDLPLDEDQAQRIISASTVFGSDGSDFDPSEDDGVAGPYRFSHKAFRFVDTGWTDEIQAIAERACRQMNVESVRHRCLQVYALYALFPRYTSNQTRAGIHASDVLALNAKFALTSLSVMTGWAGVPRPYQSLAPSAPSRPFPENAILYLQHLRLQLRAVELVLWPKSSSSSCSSSSHITTPPSPHRNSDDGCFATLTVQLPSAYTGGAVLVHSEPPQRHEMSVGSGIQMAYMACFNDCETSRESVAEGFCLTVVYSLCAIRVRPSPLGCADKLVYEN
jgi:hypothetical protein